MRVTVGQSECAGVQRHRVGADLAAQAAAHRRSGRGQRAVVDLARTGNARRRRELCRRDGSGHGRDRRLCPQRVVGDGRHHPVARAAAAQVAAARAGQRAQRDVTGRADGLGRCHVRAAEIEGNGTGVEQHGVGADQTASDAAAHRRAGRGQHAVVYLGGGGDARRRRELCRRDGLQLACRLRKQGVIRAIAP